MTIQLEKTTQCTGQAKGTTTVPSSVFFLQAKSFRYKHCKALENSDRQVEKERKQCLYNYGVNCTVFRSQKHVGVSYTAALHLTRHVQ